MGVLAIFGPTGVGKTAVALALADRMRARDERPVAVSADALQVYRGLEVLTGAATAAERERLEHRLLSFLPVDRTFSAGEYARLAHAEIDGLLTEGAQPIVVGGTGLYLRAALADLDLRPPVPAAARERLEGRDAADLHAELARRAPALARRVPPSDRHRLVRSLALLDQGVEYPPTGDELWTSRTRHPTRLVALVLERAELHAAIGERVHAMVAAGAIAEVRRADAAGASRTARRALGFDELLAAGAEPSERDRWIAAMKTRTRRYARRQLTWLRKLPGAEVVDMTGRSPEQVAADIDSRAP